MPSHIRAFESTDFDSAASLWRRTPGVGLSASDEWEPIQRFLARNSGLSFVAVEAGALVGTILCGHDGRRGLIHHLVVDTNSRRQGLATLLLKASLRALAAQGIDKAHLLVFNSNADGLAFWRKVAVERHEMALFSASTQCDA
jgi:N-acetylglutamate synthase